MTILRTLRDIHGYDDNAAARKASFHRAGRLFLQRLADDIGLQQGTYETRSNKAGPAVSGEVTLHGETFYAWLQESCVGPRGVSMTYRTCKGPKDYCGGTNHTVRLADLKGDRYPRLVSECRRIAQAGAVVNACEARGLSSQRLIVSIVG